jgi:RHS repeat-associated protein
MNRVTDMQRGTLNTAKNGLVGVATRAQSWNLDALGNSNSVTSNGVNEARSHNAQNELTSVGSSALAFDSNGNLTADQNGKTLVWDAWNRLVEVRNGSIIEATYRYDGLKRRVLDNGNTVLFTKDWQKIEERSPGGVVLYQYVWSPVYIDALIARDFDGAGNSAITNRVYPTQDANWNVTGLLNSSGTPIERYQYDAYGKRTILSGGFAVISASTANFNQAHQGGFIDAVTNRMLFRNRFYDTTLMRWVSRDPIGFEGGSLNLFEYVSSNPLFGLDPLGLRHAPGYPEQEPLPDPLPNRPIILLPPGVQGPGAPPNIKPARPRKPTPPRPSGPKGGWPAPPRGYC